MYNILVITMENISDATKIRSHEHMCIGPARQSTSRSLIFQDLDAALRTQDFWTEN